MLQKSSFLRSLRIPIFKFSIHRYNLPYNLQGIQPDWSDKTDVSDENIHGWVTTMMDPNIEDGFKYAFNNLTQALSQMENEDAVEYLRDNCEQRLYQRFRQAFTEMGEQGEKLVLTENETIEEEVRYNKMVFHIGLKHDDPVVNNFKCRHMNYMKALEIKMYPYQPDGAILQVDMLMRIKSNLNFLKNQQDLPEGPIHHVVFRTSSNGPFEQITIGKLFKFVMYRKKDLDQIHNLLFGQNFRWVIADIDQQFVQ